MKALDWSAVRQNLDEFGSAPLGTVLTARECSEIVELYHDDGQFRSTIDMARHRFGEGQYRYFDYPLPSIVASLRETLWPQLLEIARDWADRLGRLAPWPDEFSKWLMACHEAGQSRPTPLILRYGPGDWNALHRDLYGDLIFPLQVVIGLDRPGEDFTGGEFVTVEQRPRSQSRAVVAPLERGQAVAFTTRDRPVRSARGWTAAPMRHGVSPVRTGRRHALGIIFHDAA